jgi:hypothetical protein
VSRAGDDAEHESDVGVPPACGGEERRVIPAGDDAEHESDVGVPPACGGEERRQ